jgi:hypothetical protein
MSSGNNPTDWESIYQLTDFNFFSRQDVDLTMSAALCISPHMATKEVKLCQGFRMLIKKCYPKQ